VTMTRVVAVFGLLLYGFLWVLALNGDSSLEAPLLIPLVLVVLIMAGLALDRYLGITPRKQHFRDRDDEGES
jgi:membrane protease YdiL (CAAX protease family)